MSDFPGSGESAPGGANSGDPAGTTPPIPPATTGETLVYCTLPLQISENQQGVGALTRLDWKQFQTAPQLRLTLQDASRLPFNLTDALSVTLRLSKLIGGTLLITRAMTIAYAVGGIVAYHFQASDVAAPGTFSLEVEAVMLNGDTFYFPSEGNVLFVIGKSLGGP